MLKFAMSYTAMRDGSSTWKTLGLGKGSGTGDFTLSHIHSPIVINPKFQSFIFHIWPVSGTASAGFQTGSPLYPPILVSKAYFYIPTNQYPNIV